VARARSSSVWPLVLLWLVLGGVVWNVVFDLYISRGAREYLQLAAEAELGRRPGVSMNGVMQSNARTGAITATCYLVLVTAAGWATIYISRKRP
jgi:hypothetical protein